MHACVRADRHAQTCGSASSPMSPNTDAHQWCVISLLMHMFTSGHHDGCSSGNSCAVVVMSLDYILKCQVAEKDIKMLLISLDPLVTGQWSMPLGHSIEVILHRLSQENSFGTGITLGYWHHPVVLKSPCDTEITI